MEHFFRFSRSIARLSLGFIFSLLILFYIGDSYVYPIYNQIFSVVNNTIPQEAKGTLFAAVPVILLVAVGSIGTICLSAINSLIRTVFDKTIRILKMRNSTIVILLGEMPSVILHVLRKKSDAIHDLFVMKTRSFPGSFDRRSEIDIHFKEILPIIKRDIFISYVFSYYTSLTQEQAKLEVVDSDIENMWNLIIILFLLIPLTQEYIHLVAIAVVISLTLPYIYKKRKRLAMLTLFSLYEVFVVHEGAEISDRAADT